MRPRRPRVENGRPPRQAPQWPRAGEKSKRGPRDYLAQELTPCGHRVRHEGATRNVPVKSVTYPFDEGGEGGAPKRRHGPVGPAAHSGHCSRSRRVALPRGARRSVGTWYLSNTSPAGPSRPGPPRLQSVTTQDLASCLRASGVFAPSLIYARARRGIRPLRRSAARVCGASSPPKRGPAAGRLEPPAAPEKSQGRGGGRNENADKRFST